MEKKEEGTVNKVDVKPLEIAGKEPVMTEAQQQRQQAIQRKQHEVELVSYKKRVRSSNELKRLQVEELELNIAYYKGKKEWMDLAPEMEKLEQREKELQAKQEAEMRKQFEAQRKAQKEINEKEKTPEIIIPKVGKPRSDK